MLKFDIVEIFYGNESKLHRVFYDKLAWSHSKFLLFIKTCGKLSEFNFSTTHAYSLDGMMEKHDFIACFDAIHAALSV